MVVLLFEGIQGVGKTTLISELERMNAVQNANFKRPSGAKSDTYVGINRFATCAAEEDILKLASVHTHYGVVRDDGAKCWSRERYFAVDRYIASEYAFGHVCNRAQDYEWLMAIDSELAKTKKVYTVYIMAPRNFVIDNIWERRGQYTAELMIAQLTKALQYFDEYLKVSKIPVIQYFNDPSMSAASNAVMLKSAIEKELCTCL